MLTNITCYQICAAVSGVGQHEVCDDDAIDGSNAMPTAIVQMCRYNNTNNNNNNSSSLYQDTDVVVASGFCLRW